MAQPPGVLFAKQRFLHGPSALQDLSFEVLVGILFVGGGGPPPRGSIPPWSAFFLLSSMPFHINFLEFMLKWQALLSGLVRPLFVWHLAGSDSYFNYLSHSAHPHIVPTPPFVHHPRSQVLRSLAARCPSTTGVRSSQPLRFNICAGCGIFKWQPSWEVRRW